MDGRRHKPSGEGDDGRGHEGLSGLCGVAEAKEECGEVGSRSQRSTGASWTRGLAVCRRDRNRPCAHGNLRVTLQPQPAVTHPCRGTHAGAWRSLPRAL